MTPAFDELTKTLRKLPGLGYRSAERLALHLLVEQPSSLDSLVLALNNAQKQVKKCPVCANITQDELCSVCQNSSRDTSILCVVETIPDLLSIEKSSSFQGRYHVLNGKISPIKGIKPQDINLQSLQNRLNQENIQELILALPNDIEGEATCHYIQNTVVNNPNIRVSRIGFGLPSGGGVIYADSATLKSALESRRPFLN